MFPVMPRLGVRRSQHRNGGGGGGGPTTAWQTFFSEYDHSAPGALPADFTLRWDSSAGQWEVTEERGGIGMEEDTLTTLDRACSWDVPGQEGVDPTGDVELLWLVNHTSKAVRGRGNGGVLRGSGAAGSESGYVLHLVGWSNWIELLRYNGDGSSTSLGTWAVTQDDDEFFWYRMQIADEGGDVRIKCRTWAYSAAEPGTWGISFLDNTGSKITTDGWAGMFAADNEALYAVFCVGESGTAAAEPVETGTDSSENFSGGTAGQPAAGFVDHWHDTDLLVQVDAGSDGGKALLDSTSVTDRKFHRWTTPGIGRDMEVLIECETSVIGDEVGCGIRGAVKPDGAEQGIVCYASNGNLLWVISYIDGGSDNIAAPGIAYTADVKFQIRLRCIGASVKARFWLSSGAEPGPWDVDATQERNPGGYAGISGSQFDGVTIHRIAVAYGGATAAFA